MATWQMMGIQKARDGFRRCVDKAIEAGVFTLVARHGRPVVMIVSAEWGQRAAEALGEPLNFAEVEMAPDDAATA